MNVAGDYAEACHDDIHNRFSKATGGHVIYRVGSHHNFAWKENHDGKELIVHLKGATSAAEGEIGFIPGSITLPGFMVWGRGNTDSLRSASHGAGRRFSRSKWEQKFSVSAMQAGLEAHGVNLLGWGVDDAPMAYKTHIR